MNSGAKRRGTVDRRGWVLEGRPEGPIRAGDRAAELGVQSPGSGSGLLRLVSESGRPSRPWGPRCV